MSTSKKLNQIRESARVQLDMFQMGHKAYNINRSPLHQYACMQLGLAAEMLYNLLLKRSDADISNIVCLIAKDIVGLYKRIARTDQETAEKLQPSVRQLFDTLSDIALVTNTLNIQWKDIAKALLAPLPPSKDAPAKTFHEYIPPISHFSKELLLGSGGFGSAYLVKYLPTGFECCMKIISKAKMDACKTKGLQFAEKIVVSSTNSPHIISDIVCFVTPNAFVSIMNVVEGGSLDKVLDQFVKFPIYYCVPIIAQMVEAIKHMHYRGFIHRDIKPSNTLINKRGHIKVTDFDLIKICKGHHIKQALPYFFKQTHNEFNDRESGGTPHYKAPEVVAKKPYGRASDWYSVGVTMHKLMMGNVIVRDIENIEEYKNAVTQFKEAYKNNPDEVNFTIQLLKRNPAERLGSVSYAEIENHPIFKNTVMHEIWNLSEVISEIRFASVVRLIAKRGQKENDPLEMLYWRQHLMLSYGEVQDGHSKLTKKPLYAYVSKRFSKLVEKLEETDWEPFPGCETALIPRTPPSEPVDATNPAKAEPILDEQLATIEDNNNVYITLRREKKISMLFFEGVDITNVLTKSGRTVLTVSKINSECPAFECGVVYGDVIVTVDDKDASDASALTIQSSKVTLSVLQNNPFRMIQKGIEMLQAVHNCVQSKLVVGPQETLKRGNMYGITTRAERFWNGVGYTYIPIHLVNYLTKSLNIVSGNQIFFGDAIIAINGNEIEHLTEKEVCEIFQNAGSSEIELVILELSALRNI